MQSRTRAGAMTAGDMALGLSEDTPARRRAWSRRIGFIRRPVGVHLAVLIGYLAAGVAVTWTRAIYLTEHVLPGDARDPGLFVWDFWWMARSVEHLSNPWYTYYLAAPVGAPLAFHTLMPLPGVLMAPVTILFGPSFTYNLLSAAAPGLICYAMYRVARLWLPSQTGAIAAGAFFGLSTMMTWNAWYEIQGALGAIFLPLALEASVRLRRRPGWRQATILGVVLGAALLTDQESAIMAGFLALVALLPWLAGRPAGGGPRVWDRLRSAALAAVITVVVASPQLIAMIQQARDASVPQGTLAADYMNSGANLQQIFAPSPRVAFFGLNFLAQDYWHAGDSLTFTAYGTVLTLLALFGLAVCWRRRNARLLALLWLGATITALGTGIVIGGHRYVPLGQVWHGINVSMILPYTWMVRIPFLSSFREANRITELGLVPAALLAGAGVNWLRYHAKPVLVVVLAFAVLEAGSVDADPGPTPAVTMPTAMPALDRPIAADHSGSIVVDIPFGVRSAVPLPDEGAGFNPEAEVQATADGHPRAIAYISRLPESELAAVRRHPFYADLLDAQEKPATLYDELFTARGSAAARLAAAKRDARRMDVGWAIVWSSTPVILHYLTAVGFRFDYRADGAAVYRMAPAAQAAAVPHDARLQDVPQSGMSGQAAAPGDGRG
jgi:4-amino-4-deoxy-L-arabinose transferase-like glycosyltransferase